MNNTFILFEDRKAEIEFYYSIMLDIENNTGKIQTIEWICLPTILFLMRL